MGVKLKCEEIQKKLAAKVPGFGEPADGRSGPMFPRAQTEVGVVR